jgi:hypothetical protein
MAHIFISTPMYGGQCSGLFTQSLLTTTQVMREVGHTMSFTCMLNESLIQRARNALAKNFLKSQATHLMFIDSDIRFDPRHIPLMIDSDVDVICGIYPKKEINWATVQQAVLDGVPLNELKNRTGSLVVNLVDYAQSVTVPIDKPVEIWNGGTGFMLIKREVLEGMEPHMPKYTNDVLDLSGTLTNEQITEFFPVYIDPDSNRLLSEDYGFCKKAREHGFRIWAAPWVSLGHYGNYLFEGQLLPAP